MLRHFLEELKAAWTDLNVNDEFSFLDRDWQLNVELFWLFEC